MVPEDVPGMPGGLAEVLAPLFEPVKLRVGKELYATGDPADALYLVGSGWVRLFRLGAGGREVTMLVLEPGDLFGEEALQEEGRRGHFAEALTPAQVLRLRRGDFMELWTASAELRAWVLGRLVQRLHSAQGEYREHRYYRVLPRLAALLLDQMRPGKEGLEVHLSHEQMGHRVGAGRDTVTRVLGKLALRELVEINYRRVVVLDPEALKRLTQTRRRRRG